MLTREILEDLTLDELRFLYLKYLKERRYDEAEILETYMASKVASTPSITEILFESYLRNCPKNIQEEARRIFNEIKGDVSFRRYKSECLAKAVIVKAYMNFEMKIPDDFLIDKIKIFKIIERL